MRNKYEKVDVLFVNPPSPDGFVYIRDINRHGRSSWERMIWPQTNLAILAAVAKNIGFTVNIVDCIAENYSWSEYRKIIDSCMPKYCFSNLISVTYRNDLAALEYAKKISGATTIGMGPHVTIDPASAFQRSSGIDFIIRNEAEETLRELLTLYKNELSSFDNFAKVKGIVFDPQRLGFNKYSQDLVIADERPFIKDLDTLPDPLYDLLPLDKYWAPFLGNYMFVEASRGCPYRCIFCRQGIMYNWKFRTKSGVKLAKESIALHNRGINNILFHGDTFTANSKVIEDLCDTLINSSTKVRWACNTHAKNLHNNLELINKMKLAGCWMIAMGIESASDDVLKKAKKGTTVKQISETIHQIDEAGIELWGYFIIGLPGETQKTIQKTIDFSLCHPIKIAKFDIAAPYPGTEFNQIVTENNWINVEFEEQYDQNASAVVNYPDLSSSEIKKATKKALFKFYSRPARLIYIAREILKPRTFLTIVLIMRDWIRLMSSRKNYRDYTGHEKVEPAVKKPAVKKAAVKKAAVKKAAVKKQPAQV